MPTREIWEAADWKKLWRHLCEKTTGWRSMAVVPAGPGISPELSLQFAIALAYAGSLHLGEEIDVANATRIEPAQLASFNEDLAEYLRFRSRLVLALSPFSLHEASLTLARAADSALLCVLLGQIAGPAARKTIAQLGASRFAGSATFRLSSSTVAGATRQSAAPPPPPKPYDE